MPKLSCYLTVLLLALLSGCSQTFERQTCVTLAAEVNYCLAPISQQVLGNGQQALSAMQKASIQTENNQHELLSQLELSQQQLTLVGLAPLGQALFTLSYDGQSLISEQSKLLGEQFKAEYLLAIMQLIYWPDNSINQHLEGATISNYSCDAALCRGLFFAKNDLNEITTSQQPFISIRYSNLAQWQAEVELKIPAADFQLNISPL
ncbi:DUF3261 domain-containing protein [Shewanella sp. 1CM18E]|uniref:DUF3261 domain-containing protein n=1 Tax=Shewanella sp. 1CM18E TaxID=2929169 RepID=UPI0020BFC665|nr:DUF3261 domain-containing protein [Shewanella sp. 1CM18E]MCK8046548.1 DUF3261 domain-containing protein [Shewanella sp. 1CM18E]